MLKVKEKQHSCMALLEKIVRAIPKRITEDARNVLDEVVDVKF